MRATPSCLLAAGISVFMIAAHAGEPGAPVVADVVEDLEDEVEAEADDVDAEEEGADEAELLSEPDVVLGDEVQPPPRQAEKESVPRGLSLDLEACINGDCVRSSEGKPWEPARVVTATDRAFPVRLRLHLDCEQIADVRGVSGMARLVLVRADNPTLQCPLEPMDAYCEFRFWQGETRWADEIVDVFMPRAADTAWPDPEGRVDEAEMTFQLPASAAPGEYDLIAAIPKELVDLYPCESLRHHQWVESKPLRIEVAERSEPIRWQETVLSLGVAARDGDFGATMVTIEDLVAQAHSAPEGVLPLSAGEADRALAAACASVSGAWSGCTSVSPSAEPEREIDLVELLEAAPAGEPSDAEPEPDDAERARRACSAVAKVARLIVDCADESGGAVK